MFIRTLACTRPVMFAIHCESEKELTKVGIKQDSWWMDVCNGKTERNVQSGKSATLPD